MSNPSVTVSNQSSGDIYLNGDPNWDDQKLLVNGQPIVPSGEKIGKGMDVTISVEWDGNRSAHMVGMIISDSFNYDDGAAYQMTFGEDPEMGYMTRTETYDWGEPGITYRMKDRHTWEMTLEFKDKEKVAAE